MKRKPLIFTLMMMFLTMWSCQDDTEPVGPTTPPGEGFEVSDVQIVLPEGAAVDLAGAEIFSFGESFPVAGGKSQVVSTPGIGHVAFLFDKDGKPLMAGYIDGNSKEFSAKSTARVLVFLASGLWLSTEELAPKFFAEIGKYPEIQEWEKEFEALWKTNPTLLSTTSFAQPLNALMAKVMPKPKELDIRGRIEESARVSDISIDQSDVKSGIQVFEESIGSIAVNNYYRRRAHAFLYKTETKFTDGSSKVLIPSIGKGTAASKDFMVNPTTAFTSATGVVGGAIDGGAASAGVTKSEPYSITLGDNEDEHTYKVRVVGAGGENASIPMTDAERIKQLRLSMESFVLDLFLPFTMQMVGWKDDLNAAGFDVGESGVVAFIDQVEVIINASPATYDLIKQGKFKDALISFTLFIGTEGGGNKYLEPLLTKVFNFIRSQAAKRSVNIEGAAQKLDQQVLGKFTGILKVINTIMAGQDLAQVSFGIAMSKNIEEWTIQARAAKVSLLPAEATVASRGHKELTAEIKNLQEAGGDNFPYFKWSTSGKYGYIQDTKGHKGKAFESSDTKVTFYSETSANELPEENNFEYIYIEAYFKNQLIGRDTAVLNLKKSSYELKPKGLILSGKEGSTNSARLYVEPVTERGADFTGKKIVWTIEGKHGRLKNNGEYANVITTYDTNSLSYECTDEDTEKGTEKVTVRVYERSAEDGEYFLFEELSETIEINNEDDVKIIMVSTQVKSFSNQTGIYLNCGSGVHFLVEPVENAISYTAKIVEFYPGGNIMVGRSATWSAQKQPDYEGKYEFSYVFVQSGSRPENKGWPDCAGFAANAAKYKGTAQVIVKIKKQGE